MTMKRHLQALTLALSLAAAGGAFAAPESTLLVVPARWRVINLAFEMVSLRQCSLVSYQTAEGKTEPSLHMWAGDQWVGVTSEQYARELFSGRHLRHVVVVGQKGEVPPSLVADASWCPDVRVVESLDVGTLVTELDKVLKFTASEWTWVANREGLKIEDENTALRRYGRYGKPGQPPPPKPPRHAAKSPVSAVPVVMPPAEGPRKAPEAAPVTKPAEPVPAVAPAAAKPGEVPAPVGTNVAPAAAKVQSAADK